MPFFVRTLSFFFFFLSLASFVGSGWKINPLAFDSLVNQSSFTYAYGSPDIVPMFMLGTSQERVEWEVYDEEEEDFTKDAIELDTWVLRRMHDLFERGKANETVDAQLRNPKTVFFLHLLGLDTTGHTYRPMSPEYIGNTIVVDAIVREIAQLFEDYFSDDKTAFLVTADHGHTSRCMGRWHPSCAFLAQSPAMAYVLRETLGPRLCGAARCRTGGSCAAHGRLARSASASECGRPSATRPTRCTD